MMHLMSLSELLTHWSSFTALSSAGVVIRGRLDLVSSPERMMAKLRAPTQPFSPLISLLIGIGGGGWGTGLWRPSQVRGQQDAAINHPLSSISFEGCKSALLLTEGLMFAHEFIICTFGPGQDVKQVSGHPRTDL